jgi:hypothetical protein
MGMRTKINFVLGHRCAGTMGRQNAGLLPLKSTYGFPNIGMTNGEMTKIHSRVYTFTVDVLNCTGNRIYIC